MSDTIRAWYEFTLAQIAADSYLDNEQDPDFTIEQDDLVRVRFRNGANHYKHIEDNERDNNLSATRMTEVMIGDFFDTWEIIDHQENQSSGFSGTLLKHKTTGEYTLSFRSTESKNVDDGGDVERDSSEGANGQIRDLGFAYAQIQDMQEYYQTLQDDGHLDTGTKINVTGYSLGGHLAQTFTRLNNENVKHTYTFNGAGFGKYEGASSGTDYQQTLTQRLDQIQAAMADPLAFAPLVLANELKDLLNPLALLLPDFSLPEIPVVADLLLFRDAYIALFGEYESIYDDPLLQYAIKTLPDSDTGALEVSFKELRIDNPDLDFTREQITGDPKITNLYGHAIPGDDRPGGEFVAGSGQIFGEFLPVYIEDQPIFNLTVSGWHDLLNPSDVVLRSFGPGHSISLLADSLVVMDLMQSLDPGLARLDMNQIFASANNSKRVSGLTENSSRAEGDSLEQILDALGEFFLPASWTATPSSDRSGAYADLFYRNPFYDNVGKLRSELFDTNGQLKSDYQGIRITRPAVEPIDSIAYRYALKTLNPFVINGIPRIYERHNPDHELDRYDPETGLGMTDEYIKDRTALLQDVLIRHVDNNILDGGEDNDFLLVA